LSGGRSVTTVKRRDVIALVVIWVLVFVAAGLLVALAADDDPATDDAAGAGALAAIAGGILTGVYFVIVERRARRDKPVAPVPIVTAETRAATAVARRRRWKEIALAAGLWTAGALVFVVAGVAQDYAIWLGGLVALVAMLLLRRL
jgi:hypothetical protein